MSNTSLRRAAASALAIAAVVLPATAAADTRAPSTAFQQGARPSHATVPPLEIRRTMARKLRAAGHPRAARRALNPVARAAWSVAGRPFSIRMPTTGTCYYTIFSNGAVRKDISVAPPVVYAVDESPQYVYFRPYAYNADTLQVFPLAGQQKLATYTAPAMFSSVPGTFEFAPSANLFPSGALSIGIDVWWWSSARQAWISGSAWSLPMWTARRLGNGVLVDQASSWRC